MNPQSEKGFSLVEVLIASALMGMMALGFANMISQQNNQIRSLNEKMSVMDLETLVAKVLMNQSYCVCLFDGKRFNANTKTWNDFPVAIPNSFGVSCVGNGGNLLAKGQQIPSTNLYVTDLSMKDVIEVFPNSGMYTAKIHISFDTSKLVRSMKEPELPVAFTVSASDPATSKRLTSCAVDTSPPGDMGDWQPLVRTSGAVQQATADGMIFITSAQNRGIKFLTGDTAATLTLRGQVDARDSYGQGKENMLVPVKKNEFFQIFSTNKHYNNTADQLTQVNFRNLK